MADLKDCFELNDRQVISVIGSGGKSSLIRYLAFQNRKEKILCSTTTKIGFPSPDEYDRLITADFEHLRNSVTGITVAGELTAEGQKLQQPSTTDFSDIFSLYDKVFLEADGSKQLPLKGWADFEPVVLPETTMTIGVLPISVIGKQANERTVHRFSLFQKMTGIQWEQEITAAHLASIITDKAGLWKAAVGERVLYFNQTASDRQLAAVQDVLRLLPLEKDCGLSKVIAGSVTAQKGIVLWKR